ncbi:MAG: hypothetical protein N2512_05080 [Armatimonadetes bacterium]|nr:hypothetical protein [Armatimonadota bacterium]
MKPVAFVSAVAAFQALWIWAAVVNRRLHAATRLRCFAWFGHFYAAAAIVWFLATAGTRLTAALADIEPSRQLAGLIVIAHVLLLSLGLIAASTCWTAASCYRWFREYEDWKAVIRCQGAEGSVLRNALRVAFAGRVPAGLQLSGRPSAIYRWEGILIAATYLLALALVVSMRQRLPWVLFGRLPGLRGLLMFAGPTLVVWFAGCAVAVAACGVIFGKPGWRWSR